MPRKRWIKLWTQETLYGTTSTELSLSEQAIWFKLLALAGDSPEPGKVCVAPGVAYTTEQLAEILGAPVELLLEALRRMLTPEVNKIEMNGAIIKITNWEKYQGQFNREEYQRDYMRDYMRRQREDKKNVKPSVKTKQHKSFVNQSRRTEQNRIVQIPSPPPRRKQVAPDPRVKEVLSIIVNKTGHDIPSYAKEGAAVKRALAMGFTPEEFVGCWEKMKEFSFWQGKWLPLAKVTENLGEYRAGRLRGVVKRRLPTETELDQQAREKEIT